MFTVISRDDALAAGKTRYFTGKPCKFGHIAERYVTTANCSQCIEMRSSKFRTLRMVQKMQGKLFSVTYDNLTGPQKMMLDQFVAEFRKQNDASDIRWVAHAAYLSKEAEVGRDAAVKWAVSQDPCPPVPQDVLQAIADENGGKLPGWIVCTGNYYDWNM